MSQSNLLLSPDQQSLLLAALSSNQKPGQSQSNLQRASLTRSELIRNESSGSMADTEEQYGLFDSNTQSEPSSGHLDFNPDESPYLDFDIDGDGDGDGDDSYDFDSNGQMIGEMPESGELHDKRKSMDDNDDDEGGGKRREGEDKSGKKPGRKPLTSEPTTKRKAQNRAAQRAFRERKEKHLKDLETKVDDLEKTSESTNHENGLLRAQVERLQVELKEYRKRLSWVSNNGTARNSLPSSATAVTKKNTGNDFQFEFPKFGDLPGNHIFSNGGATKPLNNGPVRSATVPSASTWVGKSGQPFNSSSPKAQAPTYGSTGNSPNINGFAASPKTSNHPSDRNSGIDSLSGLFSPSIIEASRNASFDYFPQTSAKNQSSQSHHNSTDQSNSNAMSTLYNSSSVSNTDSPSSSSDSHHPSSSMGTSPEPSLSSPGNKLNELGLNTINEENQMMNSFGGEISFCDKLSTACGDIANPVSRMISESNGGLDMTDSAMTPNYDPNGFNWLAQQNGGGFDPVLFGEYREPQNAVVAQDFGTFFNDAFPLPDLGSPLHNFNEVAPSPVPKVDLIGHAEATQVGQEELVPGEDRGKLMTCNKIWDRLQSMEKFRNGEIDVDNLCAELRSKARCSEGGAVVHEKEVDRILHRAK